MSLYMDAVKEVEGDSKQHLIDQEMFYLRRALKAERTRVDGFKYGFIIGVVVGIVILGCLVISY